MTQEIDPSEAKFDRVRGGLDGLPGIKITKPVTVYTPCYTLKGCVLSNAVDQAVVVAAGCNSP